MGCGSCFDHFHYDFTLECDSLIQSQAKKSLQPIFHNYSWIKLCIYASTTVYGLGCTPLSVSTQSAVQKKSVLLCCCLLSPNSNNLLFQFRWRYNSHVIQKWTHSQYFVALSRILRFQFLLFMLILLRLYDS